jgi:hypothetical protein
MGKKGKSTEALVTGLVLTAGFGAAWALTGGWFWIFPLIFAGVLPAIKGLQGMISYRDEKKAEPLRQAASAEKEILQLAKEEGGRVTPALVALHTFLTTEEAEEILQRFVKKSYAVMQVTDDGRVEYEFPEFRRRIEGDSR